ncbi:asparagine synthase-domain-containing protein [Blastocladiella britannica]|nr:asparagine synthase-domain-containing protein [Blastocladiella britannica]
MCGIAATICPPERNIEAIGGDDASYLKRRGPDHFGTLTVTDHRHGHVINVSASLLHLRGTAPVAQPISQASGGILAWNGQLYDGLGISAHEPSIGNISDTVALAGAVTLVESESASAADFVQALRDLLEATEAEFALVVYSARFSVLVYARDPLGRRSLLAVRGNGSLQIASVHLVAATDDMVMEVPADGVHWIDLGSSSGQELVEETVPWLRPLTAINMSLDVRLEPPFHPQVLPPLATLPAAVQTAASDLLQSLSTAVRARVLATPAVPSANDYASAPIGILFSGGIDCSVVAALAHQHLPAHVPIDLINVAFENPRALAAVKGAVAVDPYLVPDRKTARARLSELQTVFPDRHWRLLERNVPYAQVVVHRARIMDTMAPLHSTMDASIAMALWFAVSPPDVVPILPFSPPLLDAQTSTMVLEDEPDIPRVLLSGLGADEQLGGYSRHRGAYDAVMARASSAPTTEPSTAEDAAWSALADQVQLDVSRIATRNLGRDDRAIGDHGREVRFPFLDTRVVRLLNSVPIGVKCDPRWRRGVGDKILLRLLTRDLLGLAAAAGEEKRALQFGARSAKLEVGSGKSVGTMDARIVK